MSDIFDEVEEEVRKERWEQLWKKYGNYFLAGAVAVVLAVGGYRAWQAYEKHRSEEASDQFLAAQQLAQSGNQVAAESAFAKLAADAPSGYATLAKFAQAAVMLGEGKREAALAVLRELTTNDDKVLADTARLQIGWVQADFAPKSELQSTLAPLLAADNPFRFAASEILAYASLRLGERNAAIAAYDKLGKDAAAPGGVRQRAGAIAEYLKANPDVTMLPSIMAPPTLPSMPVRGAPPPATVPATAPATSPSATPAPAPGVAPAPQESHPQ